MGVAVDTEEEEAGVAASAVGDTQASAGAPVRAESVVATPGGLVGLALAMARGITHPESLGAATAATADMRKSTTHRDPRLEGRCIVLAQDRKVELLPGNLLGRRAIPVAITFRKIDPRLVLRVSLLYSRVIMQAKIETYASSAWAQPQGVQRSLAKPGLDRI